MALKSSHTNHLTTLEQVENIWCGNSVPRLYAGFFVLLGNRLSRVSLKVTTTRVSVDVIRRSFMLFRVSYLIR